MINLDLTSDEMGVLLHLTANAYVDTRGEIAESIWRKVSKEVGKNYNKVREVEERAGK